jgi:hypothetical protein
MPWVWIRSQPDRQAGACPRASGPQASVNLAGVDGGARLLFLADGQIPKRIAGDIDIDNPFASDDGLAGLRLVVP